MGWICRRCSSSSADLSKKAADSLPFRSINIVTQHLFYKILHPLLQKCKIFWPPVSSDKLSDSSDLSPSEFVTEQGRFLLPVGDAGCGAGEKSKFLPTAGQQTHRGGTKHRLGARCRACKVATSIFIPKCPPTLKCTQNVLTLMTLMVNDVPYLG